MNNTGYCYGGGVYVNGGSGNTIQSGCVYSPNYQYLTEVNGTSSENVYINTAGCLIIEP